MVRAPLAQTCSLVPTPLPHPIIFKAQVEVVVKVIEVQELKEWPESGELAAYALQFVAPLQGQKVAVLDQVAPLPEPFVVTDLIVRERPGAAGIGKARQAQLPPLIEVVARGRSRREKSQYP